ncbi:ATP-binding protein [Streptomyces sp. NPDC003952]
MSTPARTDFRSLDGEIIDHGQRWSPLMERNSHRRVDMRRPGQKCHATGTGDQRSGDVVDTMGVTVGPVCSPGSVAAVRESSRRFLGELMPAVAGEAADAVVLVVSELVTNALRHGGSTATLVLTAHHDHIKVAVHDHSPQTPRPRTPDLTAGTGGFGWHMINDLAHSVAVARGCEPEGGKTITALLPRA